MTAPLIWVALGVMGVWAIYRLFRKHKWSLPLPPGPPGDPVLGHLRIMPSVNVEVAFHEWAQKYGDVVHITCFGRDIIILDSNQAAVDLLEKRSMHFSDRPSIVTYKLMGYDPDVVFMPYGDRWRLHRRLFHSHFTQKSCLQFRPIQSRNTYILIQGMMENKGNFDYLFGRFSTAIALRIGYGHQIVSDDDEYIKIARDSGDALHQGGAIGGTMIDLFPILQHFPSWFPGTHYANIARQWRWAIDRLYHLPFNNTMKQIAEGTALDSFLTQNLAARGGRLTEQGADDLRGAAAVIYVAGAETTWSSLTTFVLAMLTHPECQKLGQEEVDRVVGRDRLPTFEDWKSLPYVNCIIEEILRWNPVLPLGVPHRSTHGDIYHGMFIPKGSLIFANAKAMSRDKNVYSNPENFNPSRFLPKSVGGNGEPVFAAVFGFGRRICPGRHLARGSLFMAISAMLSTLHFSKAISDDGYEITPEVDFVSGATSHPKPFPCNISLRSEKARLLISNAVGKID